MKDPETLPKLSRAQVEQMCGEDFASRTKSVLSLLLSDFDAGTAMDAYDSFDGDPAPLVKVDDGLFFSELWHGMTGTYTDIPHAALHCLQSACKDEVGIAPLIACYFSAYADLIDAGEIDYGDEVNFCVSFGAESLRRAGEYAVRMGLPIGKLICALENSETGDPYEKLACFRVDEEDIADAICYAFDEYGYLLDPRSAAAAAALERYSDSTDDDSVTVGFAVASPHLFASEVLRAIGEKSTGSFRRDLKLLEEVTACEPPEVLIKNPEAAKLFTGTLSVEELADALRSIAGKTEK